MTVSSSPAQYYYEQQPSYIPRPQLPLVPVLDERAFWYFPYNNDNMCFNDDLFDDFTPSDSS